MILLGNGETKELTREIFTYTYTTSGLKLMLYMYLHNSSAFVSSSLFINGFYKGFLELDSNMASFPFNQVFFLIMNNAKGGGFEEQ